MQDVSTDSLGELRWLLVVTSTYGNGDPPSNAEALHSFLMKKAGPLPDLKFSVCALGDTTYDRFAQCGKDFDLRLEQLGAQRISPRVDCDADYEVAFERWFSAVLEQLELRLPKDGQATSTPQPSTVAAPVESGASVRVEPAGTRRNPASARVLSVRPLTKAGSTHEALHVVLAADNLGGFGAGDSIGVFPENDAALVQRVLDASGASGSSVVQCGDEQLSLHEALRSRLEIQALDVRLVDAVRKLNGEPALTVEERHDFLASHHVIDVLEGGQAAQLSPEQLVAGLRSLQPRMYSVASSPKVFPSEVHLLVGLVRYELFGTARTGVASHWFSQQLAEGANVRVFVQRAPGFRVAPRNEDMIMIGPGTGLAPFRAFLQERAREPGRGRSWLFFGARHRATDFYYEEEWAHMLESKALTKLDTAFSRDQTEKVYVQHRMTENEAELLEWLRDGAFVYVCGDAKRMAPDVHLALLKILSKDQSEDDAKVELSRMEREGRYLRDVY
jgi:sulfite reductase (NADPH) flavoprotein alpha-component